MITGTWLSTGFFLFVVPFIVFAVVMFIIEEISIKIKERKGRHNDKQ